MKSEQEIFDEYIKEDTFYEQLSEPEKILYIMVVRDTISYNSYLFRERVLEFILEFLTIFKRRKK